MRQFLASFGWAWAGIRSAFATQRNLRIHVLAAFLACGLSVLLGISRLEWVLLILTMALVMMAEMLNTALEATLDLISRERHPQIKFAKDVAAGAVLLTALAAVLVGFLIWGPCLLALLPA
ncbi:MAG: diacylglycerol kinase family protein [Candidatus Sericytochromatia bacterium]|nr:diacylglycerol kinase family protein [Candidatus Sericytochromatia bacterium]